MTTGGLPNQEELNIKLICYVGGSIGRPSTLCTTCKNFNGMISDALFIAKYYSINGLNLMFQELNGILDW